MKTLKIKEVIALIVPRVGSKNPKSVDAFMYQIKAGQRSLPIEWESHLLEILECGKEELRKEWPKIRFAGEREKKKIKEKMMFNVEISIQKSEPAILEKGNLEKLVSAFKVLKSFGFPMEMTIRPIT